MTNEGHEGEKLVEVISVQGEIEAKLIYSILEGEGIRVLVKSDMASGVLPFTADGMGRVRLMVRESDLTMARVAIREYQEKQDHVRHFEDADWGDGKLDTAEEAGPERGPDEDGDGER